MTSILNIFLTAVTSQLCNPDIKKDLALVSAVQDKMNEVWDIIFSLPLYRHLNLRQGSLKIMLTAVYYNYPDDFVKMTRMETKENLVFHDLLLCMMAIADEMIAFKTYISIMLDIKFERLNKRNAEHYAVGVSTFFSDIEMHRQITAVLPSFSTYAFLQTRTVGFEYVTMPSPDNMKEYVIAERMVFDSTASFLHADFFRGLMHGNAPRRCHNCKKYFLLTAGYNTCYCNNVVPGETEKTCRKVGAHIKEASAEGKTPAQIEYAKVYNRLKTRRCRGKLSVDEWNDAVTRALEIKDKAECGKLTEIEMKQIFEGF